MNNLPIQTYESVVQQRDALEKKLADVVAENAALNKFIKADCWVWDDKNETYFDACDCIPETPATDALTRELMAHGVEEFSDNQMQKSLEQRAIGNPVLSDIYNDNAMDAKVFAARIRKGINDAQ